MTLLGEKNKPWAFPNFIPTPHPAPYTNTRHMLSPSHFHESLNLLYIKIIDLNLLYLYKNCLNYEWLCTFYFFYFVESVTLLLLFQLIFHDLWAKHTLQDLSGFHFLSLQLFCDKKLQIEANLQHVPITYSLAATSHKRKSHTCLGWHEGE